MSDPITKAISVLREKGLRITEQRKAILEVLSKADSPISAEENHAMLVASQCDLVTVYRSLEQFVKAGVVELGVRENGTKVYCFGHGHGHHHHLTCRMCGDSERGVGGMNNEREEIARGYG